METFLQEKKEEKSRLSAVVVGAVLIALAVVAGGLWLLTFQPSREEQKQQEMTGAFLEGSPEFAAYTSNLIITTDFDRTSESPLGIGTIHMAIHGTIRNKGARVINGLEVTVGVVDQQNKVIKEKKAMVVPTQKEILQPNETIPVFVQMGGFKKEDDRANIRWKVSAIRFQQ